MSDVGRGSEFLTRRRASDREPCPCRTPPIALALLFAVASVTDAAMPHSDTVGAMTASAARVFRGHCTTTRTEVVDVGGTRLPVTTYTFEVGEHLKGTRRRTVTFRQVGIPGGGPRDLGRLAGLPAYSPGTEYVLFLLPESHVGLTSPAGAGDGAFVVRGTRVRRMRVRWRARDDDDDDEPRSYEALRRVVREATTQ